MIKEMDPTAASRDEDPVGDDGAIQVLHFDSQVEEAEAVVDLSTAGSRRASRRAG